MTRGLDTSFLLFSLACLYLCAADSTFRFGAVINTEGSDGLLAARNGYELVFDQIRKTFGEDGFQLEGKAAESGFRFYFKFVHRESGGNETLHAELTHQLLGRRKKNVHFLGGSQPDVAASEARISDKYEKLNYHCCVGIDSVYAMNFSRVFGIQVSNTEYTRTIISGLRLQRVGKTAFVYDTSSEFTQTTCEAALGYYLVYGSALGREDKIMEYGINFKTASSPDKQLRDIAGKFKNAEIDAVIACLSKQEGKVLVNALHDIEYSLRALFITIGPTQPRWANSFTPRDRTNYVLSAGQWHHTLGYRDSFFKTTSNYTKIYIEEYGETPPYQAAGASAVVVTLWDAIKKAFKTCDITQTGGDVEALLFDIDKIQCQGNESMNGYDRVLRVLKETDTETLFGGVKFDEFRRNVGMIPITTQIFENATNAPDTQDVETVFPVDFATSEFTYPAENRYRDQCDTGYHIGLDTFHPCIPCPKGEASYKLDAEHCNSCPNGEFVNTTGQSKCLLCPNGTHTEIRGAQSITDCVCRPGYFNLDRQVGVECYPCNEGAVCEGRISQPYPEKGYWVNTTYPAEAYPCDPPSICPGGDTLCKKGRTGRLCSACEDGYFSIFHHCAQCWHNSLIFLSYLGLLLGWYVINVNVARSLPSLEMILGWAQLANIIGDVDLNWTQMVTRMFQSADILDFDVDILEPACFCTWGFKQNFITQLFLPVLMTFMGGSGYLASTLAYLMMKRGWIGHEGLRRVLSYFVVVPENAAQLKEKWDMTIATFLASVEVTYVTIAKYCFDVFKCNDISGVSVLRVDPDVVCNDTQHKLLMGLAAIGIVVYVVGFPFYVSWKLYDLNDRECFSNPTDLRRFGFIFKKYEPDYHFTPAIVILRKLLFVLVLVYMNNPAFQVGAIAILINGSLMIHVYTAPYVDTYLDVLFSFLLLALMFEAFGGLMFYSDNLPEANRVILEWIVMVSLFILIAVFIVIFVMEMTTKYKARFVMKLYREYVVARENGESDERTGRDASSLWGLKPIVKRFVSHKESEEISFELLETFDPGFVYQALRADAAQVEDWDRLTLLLKDFMCDQSDCSYLSKKRTARFWRKLVDRFPEIVDFLATTDEETRGKFVDVATNLYRNFYLTKKATSLPLIDVINWRDYAPMAQWLAIAPNEDRQFFLEFLSRMFRSAGQEEAASTIAAKIEHRGLDPNIEKRPSIGALSGRKREILNTLIRGDDPFYHSAIEKRLAESVDLPKMSTSSSSKTGLQFRSSSSSAPGNGSSSQFGSPLNGVDESREEDVETNALYDAQQCSDVGRDVLQKKDAQSNEKCVIEMSETTNR